MFLPIVLFAFVSLCSFSVSAGDFNGSANLKNNTFEELSVHGEANLTNVTVTGDASVHGELKADQSTFEALTIHGDAKLTNVTAHGQATTHGGVDIKDSVFDKKLTVHGDMDIHDSTVNGTLTVYGKIEVVHSRLTAMRIQTRKMVLRNSSTGNIAMEKTSSGWSLFGFFIGKQEVEQTIELYDTVVKGDIDFETGGGKVYLHGNSRVTGKVTGGVICS